MKMGIEIIQKLEIEIDRGIEGEIHDVVIKGDHVDDERKDRRDRKEREYGYKVVRERNNEYSDGIDYGLKAKGDKINKYINDRYRN